MPRKAGGAGEGKTPAKYFENLQIALADCIEAPGYNVMRVKGAGCSRYWATGLDDHD